MELQKMKMEIENVRKWALKNGNTKNGLDYRMLYEAITGEKATGKGWKDRMGNADYAKAAYAYGVYAFKGLNNWDEYKRRPNADGEFLKILD